MLLKRQEKTRKLNQFMHHQIYVHLFMIKTLKILPLYSMVVNTFTPQLVKLIILDLN
jgi:hypothetical protein